MFRRTYVLRITMVLGCSLCPMQLVAQKIQDIPSSRPQKMISLAEARIRIQKAKRQVAMDRLLLEKLRAKINGNLYQAHMMRLDQKEKVLLLKEQHYDDLSKTAAKEREVHETTGARFYEEQEKYYKAIYSDDIDMRID